MILWIAFALVTTVVLGVILWPVFSEKTANQAARAQFDLTVYRDQLAEIDRDQEAALIGDAEAEAARNEVKRRMLSLEESVEPAEPDAANMRRVSIIAGIAGIPAAAMLVYLNYGSPNLPSAPRAERIANAEQNQDLPALTAKVEQHLAENPKDSKGWLVLAPIYRRAGRFSDAANAISTALKFIEGNADQYAELGENLVLANQGLVIADAREAFEKALSLEPQSARSKYYISIALAQEGKRDEALAGFNELLQNSPPNAPWRGVVEQQIASLDPEAASNLRQPAPDGEQADAIRQLSTEQQQEFIRNMVDSLAARLNDNGKDLDGWLRLANARMVLGEKEKAAAALDKAKQHFSGDSASLSRIAEIRQQLGL